MLFLLCGPFYHCFGVPIDIQLSICLSFAILRVALSAESSALLLVALPRSNLKDILFVSDKWITPPAPPMVGSPWLALSKKAHGVLLSITGTIAALIFPAMDETLCSCTFCINRAEEMSVGVYTFLNSVLFLASQTHIPLCCSTSLWISAPRFLPSCPFFLDLIILRLQSTPDLHKDKCRTSAEEIGRKFIIFFA